MIMALSISLTGAEFMPEIGRRPLRRKSYAIKEAGKFLKVIWIIIEEGKWRLL